MQHFIFLTGYQNLLWALKSKNVWTRVATMSLSLILVPANEVLNDTKVIDFKPLLCHLC